MERDFMQNAHLDGETFHLEAGQPGILLFHGFTATTTEVRLIANRLIEYGYTISGPLLPGHGTHPDDLNKTKRTDWIHAAEFSYQVLADNHQPVWVGGESMGALISLYLAAQHPEIAGVLLYSPAIHVRGVRLSRYLSPFLSYRKKPASRDQLPWKGYNVYPVRAASEFYRFQNDVFQCLPKIQQPVLILLGRLDHTIDSDSGKIIINRVQSKQKELHWLENSPHCLLLNGELDKALDYTLDFLNRTSPISN